MSTVRCTVESAVVEGRMFSTVIDNDRLYGIYSWLLNERVLCVDEIISDELAYVVVAKLLYLDKRELSKPITMYINFLNSSTYAKLAIYDGTLIHTLVSTICIRQATSMGSLLLDAGAKGKRMALLNALIMICQPLGGKVGSATNLEIHVKELANARRRMDAIYAWHIGKGLIKIKYYTEKDLFMTAEEPRDLGLIDRVIKSVSDVEYVAA